MRLLFDQVAAMELELRNGAGIPIAELDAAVGGAAETDDGVGAADVVLASPSAVITAWMDIGGTPASMLAAELVGAGDGESAADLGLEVLPQIVLVLFTSDLAIVGDSLPERVDEAPSGWASPSSRAFEQPAQTGVCSSVIGWVNGVVASVFNAIGHLRNPPLVNTGFGLFDTLVNTVGKAVVGGVNAVIDGANFVISNTVRIAIGTVMSFVGRIAGVVGTVAIVVSAIRPWTLRVEADPPNVEAPGGGTIRASIDLGGFDEWPPVVADCAAAAGVPLPPLRPSGNPVTWNVPGAGLIASDSADPGLRADGTALHTFHVIAEPPLPDGPNVTDEITVGATVQRDDLRELEEKLIALIQNELAQLVPPIGSIVSPLVMPLVKPWIDRAFTALSQLRNKSGTTRISVRHPDPNRPPPTAAPTTLRVGPPNPCSLITQAEADAVSGFATTPTLQATEDESFAALGTGQACPFIAANTDSPIALVRITVIDLGDDAAAKFAAWKATQIGMDSGSVAGLGDENFYFSSPGAVGILFIRVQNLFISVSVITPDGLAQATRLAELALSRL